MDDKDKLLKFLERLEEVLKHIAYSQWLLGRRIMRNKIFDAFQGVQETIAKLRGKIGDPSEELAERLKEAGLTGKQLDLKYQGFDKAWRAFNAWGGMRLLKKLLDWIDIILGSIPGAEAVKEFKEVCEKEMDSTDG